jgi:hypothetical protein
MSLAPNESTIKCDEPKIPWRITKFTRNAMLPREANHMLGHCVWEEVLSRILIPYRYFKILIPQGYLR